MSAMESMLKNILLSVVPPEVMASLTKENVELITTRAKEFVDKQEAIFKELGEQRAILEEIKSNVGSKRSSGGRAISPSTSGPSD
jgi:hypothetical protein